MTVNTDTVTFTVTFTAELTAELTEQYGRFMSYQAAGKECGCHPKTLHRLTAAGQLPCYTVGRSRTMRVRTADVAALMTRVA